MIRCFQSRQLQICCMSHMIMWERVKVVNKHLFQIICNGIMQPNLGTWIHCSLIFNPSTHTTILHQTTLNIFWQKIENLYNWMDNLWLKGENIVAKGEIARFEQFLLLSLMLSKSHLLQRRQKASIWGKGLTITKLNMYSLTLSHM